MTEEVETPVTPETPEEEINEEDEEQQPLEEEDPAPTEEEQQPSVEENDPCSPFDQSAMLYGVIVSVHADAGVFPAGAALSVTRVLLLEQKQAEAAVEDVRDENENVAASYTFDIKVIDPITGAEYQPADGQVVSVSFSLAEVADENLTTSVYHIAEDAQGMTAEPLEVTTEDEVTATVETDGFSIYTVEFTYGSMQYVLDVDGSGTVPLATILEGVHLAGEVTSVAVSNEDLLYASQKNGAWTIHVFESFNTEEWLKVTINGLEYTIMVTQNLLVVTTWQGRTIPLSVKPSDTIGKIKERISAAERYNFPDKELRLFHYPNTMTTPAFTVDSPSLDDDSTLEECGIGCDSRLYLSVASYGIDFTDNNDHETKGTVTVDAVSALAGQVVTVTSRANPGYYLTQDRLSVTWRDEEDTIHTVDTAQLPIESTDSEGHYTSVYTFVMPMQDVKVEAIIRMLVNPTYDSGNNDNLPFEWSTSPITTTTSNTLKEPITVTTDVTVEIPASRTLECTQGITISPGCTLTVTGGGKLVVEAPYGTLESDTPGGIAVDGNITLDGVSAEITGGHGASSNGSATGTKGGTAVRGNVTISGSGTVTITGGEAGGPAPEATSGNNNVGRNRKGGDGGKAVEGNVTISGSGTVTIRGGIDKSGNVWGGITLFNNRNGSVPNATLGCSSPADFIKVNRIVLARLDGLAYGTVNIAQGQTLFCYDGIDYIGEAYSGELSKDDVDGFSAIDTVNDKTLRAHAHDFTYEASGDTVTATCGARYCTLENSQASVTLAAPAGSLTYDGTAKPAAVTGDTDVLTTSAIAYQKSGVAFNGTPTGAGSYTASVTVGEAEIVGKGAGPDLHIMAGRFSTFALIYVDPALTDPVVEPEPVIQTVPGTKKTNKATVTVGNTYQIDTAGKAAKKFSSSNKKVATVKNGVVKFKKKGKVTITATARRGGKKAKVKFVVGK